MEANKYSSIDASPVKRFFVEMLTRDIQIEDAILDLLDNCVDGILRSNAPNQATETPYDGFWAKVRIEEDSFEIEDNCGGIPWSEHDRAFRMGRPNGADQTIAPMSVGVYGIGMKRALFKLGKSSFVITQNHEDSYQVLFSEEWILNEKDWDLKVESYNHRMEKDGTHLIVQDLYQDVQERFRQDTFLKELIGKIASHYAVIIRKGFRVEVNGSIVEPKPIRVRFSDEKNNKTESIQPYLFTSNYEGVEIFVAVGLRDPIPGFDRMSEEQDGVNRYASDYAGWTVICNDRVVLYCDRSELTGWGILGIPRYHTQFIAISGVVEFRGDPTKLPTTTTKRGLKFESSLYQQVLQRMIEGLRLFVNFTNKWKTMESEAETIVNRAKSLPYPLIKDQADKLQMNPTRSGIPGRQYLPNLPMPPNSKPDVRISYTRSRDDIDMLAEKLIPDIEDIRDGDIPRMVGIASFEYAYKALLNN